MAGRGGRGSALLKALEEPARKPGTTTTSQASASGDHNVPQPSQVTNGESMCYAIVTVVFDALAQWAIHIVFYLIQFSNGSLPT